MIAVPSSSGLLECSVLLATFADKSRWQIMSNLLSSSSECNCNHHQLIAKLQTHMGSEQERVLRHMIGTITHASADSQRQRWFESFALHSNGCNVDIFLAKMCDIHTNMLPPCTYRRPPLASIRIAGMVGHTFAAFNSAFFSIATPNQLACVSYRLTSAYVDNLFVPDAWATLCKAIEPSPVASIVEEYDYVTEQVACARVPCENLSAVSPTLLTFLWNSACAQCNTRAFLNTVLNIRVEQEVVKPTAPAAVQPHLDVILSDADISCLQNILTHNQSGVQIQ